jgi:hypothetical protein
MTILSVFPGVYVGGHLIPGYYTQRRDRRRDFCHPGIQQWNTRRVRHDTEPGRVAAHFANTRHGALVWPSTITVTRSDTIRFLG